MSKVGQRQKRWHAIYTMPRAEKKVSDRLAKAGFEVYCPTTITLRQWSDRKKRVETPLFTSYVFVRLSEPERMVVLSTVGVRNFVFWLGKPAVIRDEEIVDVKKFLDDYQDVATEPLRIAEGQSVEIIQGQLTGVKGKVERVKKSKVCLVLETLGVQLVAEIDKAKVCVIN